MKGINWRLRMLSVCLFVVVSAYALIGCGKEIVHHKGKTPDNLANYDTFVIEGDSVKQSYYWTNRYSNIAATGEGYYFIANDKLMYMDSASKNVKVVCEDNVPKGTNLAYADGKLYQFQYNAAKKAAFIVNLPVDGTNDWKHVCQVDVGDEALMGGMRMIVKDDYFYVYNNIKNGTAENVALTRYSVDGKEKKNIAEFDGKMMAITVAKSYGNKLFYIVEQDVTAKESGRVTMQGDGVYVYDFVKEETMRILSGNVKDFGVDVETNTIYYYVSGEGLYKKSLEKKGNKDAKKLYNATEETYESYISYDGKYLYVNNEEYLTINRAYLMGEDVSACTVVLNLDGNVINTIPAEECTAEYGDDKYYFVTMKAIASKPGGIYLIEKAKIATATDDDYELVVEYEKTEG